LCTEKLKT